MKQPVHPSQTVFDLDQNPYKIAFLEAVSGQLLNCPDSVIPEITFALQTLPPSDLYRDNPDLYEKYSLQAKRLLVWFTALQKALAEQPTEIEFNYTHFWDCYLRPYQRELADLVITAECLLKNEEAQFDLQTAYPQAVFGLVRSVFRLLDERIAAEDRPLIHQHLRLQKIVDEDSKPK